MNGKPHDDPALDIVRYGLPVFSAEADGLVRDLSKLMEFRRLQDFLHPLVRLSVGEVEAALRVKLAELKNDSKARGWEVE